MIMTDQDQDGSHIKGLLINFIHHFWPSLLKLDDFLVEFVTPIVKCTKGKKEVSFFTLPQYENWVQEVGSLKGWRVKYYKGLGTSTPAEAKEYFSQMDEHQKRFAYECEEDFESIEMAFSKKAVEQRKEWLANFKPGTFLDHSVDVIPYRDFINKELILFSMADNARSIPSVMDGFKPGQRKVRQSRWGSCVKAPLHLVLGFYFASFEPKMLLYRRAESLLCFLHSLPRSTPDAFSLNITSLFTPPIPPPGAVLLLQAQPQGRDQGGPACGLRCRTLELPPR